MPTSITYRGKRLFEPSVVVNVVNTLAAEPALGSKNLCVVGDFPVLKKNTPVAFNTGAFELSEVYPMDATLLTLDKVWKSALATQEGVATSLTYVSANQSTPAEFQFESADAVDNNTMDLTSTYYGTTGNDIRVKLDDPASDASLSAAGPYYKLTVRAPWQDQDAEFVIDGGSRLQLTLADGDQLEITDAKALVYTPSGQASQTFVLTAYSRMDELVAVLPAVLAPIAISFSKPEELDVLDYTSVGANDIVLHAHTAELLRTINDFDSIPFEAVLSSGYHLMDERALSGPDTAGANGGAITDAQYAAAFAAVENKDITSITILSQTLAHHILLKGHIELALIAGRERNGFVGAPPNLSIADLYSGYVLKMNDSRVSVSGQGITFTDHKGGRRVEGPEYLAFLMMCAQGALPPSEPLTRKGVNIFDTSENWDREKDANSLAQKSILGIKLGINNQLEVIRGLTSWRKDNLSVNTEISTKESIDTCVRDLRKFLNLQLGSRITRTTQDKVKALTKRRLSEMRDAAIIQDFKNIALRREADTIFIDFDVALIEPLNFIRITANIVAGQ